MKTKFSIFSKVGIVALILATFQLHSQNFTRLNSGVGDNLLGVSAPTNLICYVTGSNGRILRTPDGGATWIPQQSNLQPVGGVIPALYSTYFTGQNRGYAVGDNGAAIRTIDGGQTWTPMNVPAAGMHLRSVRFADDQGLTGVGFITGGSTFNGTTGVIYRTTNGGATWAPVLNLSDNNAGFYSISFIPQTGAILANLVVFASRFNGDIYRSNDGGTNWTLVNTGTMQSASQIYFTSATNGVIGSSNGNVFSTSDGGNNWAATPQQTPDYMNGIDFCDGTTNGYYVGGNVAQNTGTILNTTDGGANWTPVAVPAGTSRLYSVDFFNCCTGYAVGLNGTILKLGTVVTTPTPSVCIGSSISLTAVGSSTYTWAPATGLSATNGATVIANPTVTTIYTVTGTDVSGCSSRMIITVTVLPLPTVTVSNDVIICDGLSTTLTAAGATSYSWSPATDLSSTAGASVTAKPSVTTIYTVTGMAANGCTSTADVTVTILPRPVITISPMNPVICGGTITLTAGGAETYVWAPSSSLNTTVGATVIANPTITTLYSVTGTGANGCKKTKSVTVTVLGVPTITSFSPAAGKIGDVITIVGTGFSPVKSNNIIFFGAARSATPITASETQLTVAVPSGASSNFITVTNLCDLTAYSPQKFVFTYCGGNPTPAIATSSFEAYSAAADYPTGMRSRFSAIADFDKDGKDDIVLIQESPTDPDPAIPNFSVLRNIYTTPATAGGAIKFVSSPNFTITGGGKLQGVAVGDLDADGKLDLAIVDPTNKKVYVYKNACTVTSPTNLTATNIQFTLVGAFTVGNTPKNIAINDLNADGRPDIVVTSTDDNGICVLQNNTIGNGIISFATFHTFSVSFLESNSSTRPEAIAIGDLDNDLKPDIAVTLFNSPFVVIFRNKGVGNAMSFVNTNSAADKLPATGKYNQQIAIADLNRDGKMDIVTDNSWFGYLTIYKNEGSTFAIAPADATQGSNNPLVQNDYKTVVNNSCFAIGDINGDNMPDVAISTYNGGVKILENKSTYNGTSISLSPAQTTNSSGAIITVAGITIPTGAYGAFGCFLDDFNGDGTVDIAAPSFADNRVIALRNIIPNNGPCTTIKSFTETEPFIEADENSSANDGKIYPNPSSGNINIYPISGNEPTTILIMDAVGRFIFETKIMNNDSPIEVDISNQPAGIYFVRLMNGSNMLNKKIIKQ